MRPGWLHARRFNSGRDQDVDRQHAAVVVRTLAASRLVLAVFALGAVTLDPLDAPVQPTLRVFLIPLLVVVVAYSIGMMVGAGVRPAVVFRHGTHLHFIDLAWIVTLTTFSDGANSPFVAFFLYSLFAAGYLWGLPATLATGIFAIVVLAVQALVSLVRPLGSPVHLHTALMRIAYMAVPAVLIGLLAEEEWRQRSRSRAVARIMSRVRADIGLVASMRAVFDEVLSELDALRGLLTLEEEGGTVFLWHVRRPASTAALDVRLSQQPKAACDNYMFELPPDVDVLRGRRGVSDAAPEFEALDQHGIRLKAPKAPAAPLLAAPIPWQKVLCMPRVAGEGWRGRLFVFDPGRSSDHDLRFLQVVVRQVAPALFNLYLQRRLQSRGGVVDRLRISRELHDGVIQSLIGLEMELEVLRREAEPCMAETTRKQLATIQQVLGHEILSVRDLMQMLQPVEVEPRHLLEYIAETLERFRDKTGIQARLLSSVEHVDLPRRICNELVRVIQEALSNVRKHSGASNVLVRLDSADGRWQVTIEDDGKGFDFEGRLTDEALDAERRGPVVIKERLKGIGGRLVIDSRPGRGARLEITIPR